MPLPSFTTKTDLVDIIYAADVNNLQNEVAPTAAASAHVRYSTSYTSTTSVTLTDSDMPVQSINFTAAGNFLLPAISTANHPFYLINRSTSITSSVTFSGSTLNTLPPGFMGIAYSDSTSSWKMLTPTPYSLGAAISGLTADTTPDITSDYIPSYDTSASSAKKVILSTIAVVNPNELANGGMQVVSRGPGPFTSVSGFVNNDDSYLIDQWIFLANGSDTCDVSQVADTDFVSGYKQRLDVETANRRFGIFNIIENKNIQDIRKSGTASLQFKVKCIGTSMSNVRAYVLSWNSTADTVTSDCISSWGSAGSDPTFASNWTAENTGSNLSISTSVATKKIEGIVVDTSGVTNIGVLIIVDDTDASVGDFLEIGDVKLEAGPICTNYTNDDFDAEVRRCQRYVQKSMPLATEPTDNLFSIRYAGFAPSTTEINVPVQYVRPMRTTPAFTFYRSSQNTSAGKWGWFNGVSYADSTATALADSADSGVGFCVTLTVSGASANAAYICKGGWFATAEL